MALALVAFVVLSAGAVAAVSAGATAPVSDALAVEQPVAARDPISITTATILPLSFMTVFLPNLALRGR